MFNNVLSFIKNNFKLILQVGLGVFLLYWIVFVLTPKSGLTVEEKQKLDSLNLQINSLHEDNKVLESQIEEYNKKIDDIDNDINKIKGQKTIIKEIYHEKIDGVDKLTLDGLDSFFTDRYKY